MSNQQEIEKYNVVLPCAPKDFGRFVSSVLGKPQKIERRLNNAFKLDRKDVSNIYQLLETRIDEQNDASLIQFTSNITYDNNSSHEIDGLDGFIGYTEVEPLVSQGVTLSWTFLIKFKNSDFPEKQTIFISFNTLSYSNRGEASRLFSMDSRVPQIVISIEHTNRTWGADIESLLMGYVTNTFIQVPPLRSFVNKNSIFAGILATATLIGISLYGANLATSRYFANLENKYSGIRTEFSLSGSSVERKLDFLASYVFEGTWYTFQENLTGFTIISLVLAAFFGLVVFALSENKPASHVLLTEKSYKRKALHEKAENRGWMNFLIGIVVSITTGVMSSIIFVKFFA